MKHPETARRLTYILNLRKMTAQELSNKSGVGKSSISHYVNGTNEPHNKNAGLMADALGVNPQWLMGFDVEMQQNEATMRRDYSESHRAFMLRIEELSKDMTEEQKEHILKYAKYIKITENDSKEVN